MYMAFRYSSVRARPGPARASHRCISSISSCCEMSIFSASVRTCSLAPCVARHARHDDRLRVVPDHVLHEPHVGHGVARARRRGEIDPVSMTATVRVSLRMRVTGLVRMCMPVSGRVLVPVRLHGLSNVRRRRSAAARAARRRPGTRRGIPIRPATFASPPLGERASPDRHWLAPIAPPFSLVIRVNLRPRGRTGQHLAVVPSDVSPNRSRGSSDHPVGHAAPMPNFAGGLSPWDVPARHAGFNRPWKTGDPVMPIQS